MSLPDSHEPRNFGLPTATFVVIASMIGTGVLTTSGFTTFATRSNGLMLLLWILGGLVALCGALSLAELAAALPRSGGDYVFLHEAFGPLPAFLSGWVSFLLGFGGPIAVSSSASARYLLQPFAIPPDRLPLAHNTVATAEILLLVVIHSQGHAASRRAQGSTTIIKLIILSALAACGIAAGASRWHNVIDARPVDAPTAAAMLFSLVYISYAYTGWNGAAYIAGEVSDARRLVPRAILLGTGIVTALYLALNLFYALALSANDVANLVVKSPNGGVDTGGIVQIAGVAAGKLFGSRVASILSVCLGATLLASVSAYVLTGPRVAYAMARSGQFPAIAGLLSPRTGAPVLATCVQGVWAIILLWSGPFQSVIEYASVGLALISLLTVASLFRLRRTRPDLPRPFRTPCYPVVPLIYMAATTALCVAALWQKPREAGLATASLLLGIPVYWLWQWTRARSRVTT